MVIDSQTSCIPRGGGQERCVFEYLNYMQVCNGVLALVSDRMYMMFFKWMCTYCRLYVHWGCVCTL